MKIVYNACFGGFSLSHKAFLKLREMKNEHALEEPDYGECYGDGSGPRKKWLSSNDTGSFLRYIPRDDPDLIKIIGEMGEEANGYCANLAIVDIPDGVEWQIEEYDGLEHVAEKHRTWPSSELS